MELPPTISMKSPNNSTVTGPEEANGEVDIEKRGDKKKGKGNDEAHLLLKTDFAGKQVNERPQWNEKCK